MKRIGTKKILTKNLERKLFVCKNHWSGIVLINNNNSLASYTVVYRPVCELENVTFIDIVHYVHVALQLYHGTAILIASALPGGRRAGRRGSSYYKKYDAQTLGVS